MINDDFADDDDIEFGLDEIELHRTDDPNVWGLSDVARGRTPVVPTTIYKSAGDSASGVAGLLFPDNTFLPTVSSGVAKREYRFQDGGADDGQVMPAERKLPTVGRTINAPLPTEFFGVVAWDGAVKSEPVDVVDEDTGETSVSQEHSKGLLLGTYEIRKPIIRAVGGVIANYGYRSSRQVAKDTHDQQLAA